MASGKMTLDASRSAWTNRLPGTRPHTVSELPALLPPAGHKAWHPTTREGFSLLESNSEAPRWPAPWTRADPETSPCFPLPRLSRALLPSLIFLTLQGGSGWKLSTARRAHVHCKRGGGSAGDIGPLKGRLSQLRTTRVPGGGGLDHPPLPQGPGLQALQEGGTGRGQGNQRLEGEPGPSRRVPGSDCGLVGACMCAHVYTGVCVCSQAAGDPGCGWHEGREGHKETQA